MRSRASDRRGTVQDGLGNLIIAVLPTTLSCLRSSDPSLLHRPCSQGWLGFRVPRSAADQNRPILRCGAPSQRFPSFPGFQGSEPLLRERTPQSWSQICGGTHAGRSKANYLVFGRHFDQGWKPASMHNARKVVCYITSPCTAAWIAP